MRSVPRLVGLVVCVVGLGTSGPLTAAAMPAPQDPGPAVWHLQWTRLADRGERSVQHGPWVFVLSDQSGAGVLFNLTAGTSTQLTPPTEDCSGLNGGSMSIGGGWLMLDCADSTNGSGYPTIEELYSLRDGTWRTFDSSVAEQRACGTYDEDPRCFITAVGIGAHWVQFSIVYDGIPTSPSRAGWENLDTQAWKQTGYREERFPGLGPRTMLDLNSPSLLAPVCAPIRLPHQGRLVGTAQGLRSPVQISGRFAIVGDPYASSRSYFPTYGHSDHSYLEHCGRRHRRALTPKQATGASNGQVLLWNASESQMAGMYLISGQRFVTSLGPATADGRQLEITPQDVIQLSSSGIWDAPLPTGT